MTQVIMFLSVISMAVGANPNSYCPAGVMMCRRRCQGFSGCSMVDYVLKDLRCRLISGPSNSPSISDAIRLDAKDVSASKAMKCPLKFKWIFTKKASYACVDPGTATGKTKKHTSSEGNGLLTFSRRGLNKYQINLIFLNSKKWITLHTIQAKRALALASRNNLVFWCHEGPDICGRFVYKPEMRGYTKMKTRHMFGSSIAVDETEDAVFLAAGSKMVHVLTCFLVRKKGFPQIHVHMTVMSVEVIPSLKRLYLMSRNSPDVIAVNYRGVKQKQFIYRERGLFMAFSPDGRRIYTTYDNGTMNVVQVSYDTVSTIKTIQVSRGKSEVRVVAFNDKVLASIKRKLFVYDPKDDMATRGVDQMTPLLRMKIGAPMTSYVQPPMQGDVNAFAEEEPARSKTKPRPKKTLSSSSDVWGKQRLLTITTTLRKSMSFLKVSLGDPNSDKWKLVGYFKGVHVAMDYSEKLLYHCQRKPDGLFTLNIQDGRQKKHKKIVDGACSSVAVDPVLVRVFFIKSPKVFSYNLESKKIESLPIEYRGRLHDYRVVVETREHMVYAYRLGDTRIRKYDHTGRFQALFSTKKPIKDLIIYSGKSNSTLYCIHDESPSEVKQFFLPGWARTIDFGQTGTHKWKPISSMAATDSMIILTHGRFIRVVDSKTLREDSTVMSKAFKQSFTNLLII